MLQKIVTISNKFMKEETKKCDCLPDQVCDLCWKEKEEEQYALNRGFKTVQEMKAFDLRIEVKLNQIKQILSGTSIGDIELLCIMLPNSIKNEQVYTYKQINKENKNNN